MARVIENCALAMSPLVLAVGSQAGEFWAVAGAARAAPSARAAATLFEKTFIKDLPDLLKRVEKLPVIYRPAFFVPATLTRWRYAPVPAACLTRSRAPRTWASVVWMLPIAMRRA